MRQNDESVVLSETFSAMKRLSKMSMGRVIYLTQNAILKDLECLVYFNFNDKSSEYSKYKREWQEWKDMATVEKHQSLERKAETGTKSN